MGEGHQEHHRGPGPRLLQQLMETLELEETAGEQHWEETPAAFANRAWRPNTAKLKVKAFQSPSPPGTLPPLSKGDVHTERKNQHPAARQLNNHRNKWPFKPDATGDTLVKDPPVPEGGGWGCFSPLTISRLARTAAPPNPASSSTSPF